MCETEWLFVVLGVIAVQDRIRFRTQLLTIQPVFGAIPTAALRSKDVLVLQLLAPGMNVYVYGAASPFILQDLAQGTMCTQELPCVRYATRKGCRTCV